MLAFKECKQTKLRSIELVSQFTDLVRDDDDEETVAVAALHILLPACSCAAGLEPSDSVALVNEAAEVVFAAIFGLLAKAKANGVT